MLKETNTINNRTRAYVHSRTFRVFFSPRMAHFTDCVMTGQLYLIIQNMLCSEQMASLDEQVITDKCLDSVKSSVLLL